MCTEGTSPVVQWLTLCALNAGGPGSIPGQGTRSHMPQLKIPHTATKTQCSQINKNNKKKKRNGDGGLEESQVGDREADGRLFECSR